MESIGGLDRKYRYQSIDLHIHIHMHIRIGIGIGICVGMSILKVYVQVCVYVYINTRIHRRITMRLYIRVYVPVYVIYIYAYVISSEFYRWIGTVDGHHDQQYRSIVSALINRSIADDARLCQGPCQHLKSSVFHQIQFTWKKYGSTGFCWDT